MNDVTRLLEAIDHGDPKAAEQLLPLVYDELRGLAARKMARESEGHTLQPTALVHEAWLRLAGDEDRKWNDRTHFFAAAAEAMRRILVDNARRKTRQRRGGDQQRVELNEELLAAPNDEQVVAVNNALEKLATVDKAKAELVKLRYFVGLTIEEAAEVRGISPATAKRHWTYARTWLYAEITSQNG
jgi:RNA polymerase sigma factor (TIGR02999 family)